MKQSIINTKKGIPLNQAFGAVLMLTLLGVLVIIAIFMFVSLGSTFNTISATTTNESGAWLNQSGYPLDNRTACGFNSLTITNIVNASAGVATPIAAANFTASADGVLLNATTATFADVNVSYTYLQGGDACTANNVMITQFGTYPVLVGLVGTIIFLGIVIGVLVASFVFGRRDGI